MATLLATNSCVNLKSTCTCFPHGRNIASSSKQGVRRRVVFVAATAIAAFGASFKVHSAVAARLPPPMQPLCEAATLVGPAAYTVDAEVATTHRTVFIRDCSFGAGLALTSAPPGAVVSNAAIYIIDAKVSGTLSLNVVLGAGASLDVIGIAPLTTGGTPPNVALLGSLLLGAQMSFHASKLGAVSSSQRVSRCARLQLLTSTMTQLMIDSASSFTASAAFVLRGSTVTAAMGQSHAVRMGGALVDSLFELSSNTVTGSTTGAAVAFDAVDLPAASEQGTNCVINVTGNTLRVGATAGTYTSGVFVLGFNSVAAPATSPLSYLRVGTLLALAANTFIAGTSTSGTVSDVPLVFCRSYGALVTHDGANSGAGGRVDFITSGPSTTTAVLGSQLVLRNYLATKSITVSYEVPVEAPTLLTESCVTQTMAITNSYAVSGGSFMVSGGTVSTKLTMGGPGALEGGSRTVVQVTSVIPTLEVKYSQVSASVVEINGCTTGGLSFSFPIELSAVVMVRNSKVTASGFSFSGAMTSGSTLHVEGNTITHSGQDAVVLWSTTVTGQSAALFVGNTLTAAAFSNLYAFYIPAKVTSGRVVIAKNTGVKGGVFMTGSFTTAEASLLVTGNTFSPSISTSGYIFCVLGWHPDARFYHSSDNKYTGTARPFRFTFTAPSTSIAYAYNAQLFIASSSVFSSFDVQHWAMASGVRNDYRGCVVSLDGVTVGSALTISPQFASQMSYVLNGVTISAGGTLSLEPNQADGVSILVKGSSSVAGLLKINPSSVTNCMLSVESSTANGGVDVSGAISGGTSIVLRAVSIPNEKRIVYSLTSACTLASSCLIALWGITLKGTLSSGSSLVKFGGSIGAYTHIDIFQCLFETLGSSGDIHSLEFTSGNPLGTASLAIVETTSKAYNTLIFKDDCYSLYMPSTYMSGGIDIFGSYFDGDGVKVNWQSSAMIFIHLFKTYIYQQSFSGAATSLSTSQTSCLDKSVSLGRTLTCPSSVQRCGIQSSFAKPRYNEMTNNAYPGSCINLPDIQSKINAASIVAPIPNIAVGGSAYTHSSAISGTVATAVTTLTCGARRDRLASLRSLFAYPTTSARVMFSSASSCGGVPPASFAPTLAFAEEYTHPQSRIPRWCNASMALTPSDTVKRSGTLSTIPTRPLTVTASETPSDSLVTPPTATPTGTPSQQPSQSHSPSASGEDSRSPSANATTTPTALLTPSATHANTPSHEPTASATLSKSASVLPPATFTPSQQPSQSLSASATGEDSRSPSVNSTATPTWPITPTVTYVGTPSHAPTASPTLSASVSLIPPVTSTPTLQQSQSHSLTSTGQISHSPSLNVTTTPTAALTPSVSFADTPSRTATTSPSITATASAIPPATLTPSQQQSQSHTHSATGEDSRTPSANVSATFTAVPTPTVSDADTSSHAPTETPTLSLSATVVPPATFTLSQQQSQSHSRTLTDQISHSPSVNMTRSPTPPLTPSATDAHSPSHEPTASATLSKSASVLPPATHTPSQQQSQSHSASVTGEDSHSPSVNATATPTWPLTPTVTDADTPSEAPTASSSISEAPTLSQSASVIPPATFTPSEQQSQSHSASVTGQITSSPSVNASATSSWPRTRTVSDADTNTPNPTPTTTSSASVSAIPPMTPTTSLQRSRSHSSSVSGEDSRSPSVNATRTPTWPITPTVTDIDTPSSAPTASSSLTASVSLIPPMTSTTSLQQSQSHSSSGTNQISGSPSVNVAHTPTLPLTHSVSDVRTPTHGPTATFPTSHTIPASATVSLSATPPIETPPVTASLTLSSSVNHSVSAVLSLSSTALPTVSLTVFTTASTSATHHSLIAPMPTPRRGSPTPSASASITLTAVPSVAAVANHTAPTLTVPLDERGRAEGGDDVGFDASVAAVVMVALFDAQAVAAMSQQGCASGAQRGRFASWLLLTPASFGLLSSDGGGALITLAVLAAALGAFVVAGLICIAFVRRRNAAAGMCTCGDNRNDAVVATPTAGSSPENTNDADVASFDQKGACGVCASASTQPLTLWAVIAFRCRGALWLVLLQALFPGAAFAAVASASDPSSSAAAVAVGIVSAIVLFGGVLIGLPLMVRFGLPSRVVVSPPLPDLDAESCEAAPRRSLADRAIGYWLRDRRFVLSQLCGDAHSTRRQEAAAAYLVAPVATWVTPHSAWTALPFVSGAANALLLGPGAAPTVADSAESCIGLFGASAALHALLAALVAVARPYPTRLQNGAAFVGAALTATALVATAVGRAAPSAAEAITFVVLAAWCLHMCVALARMVTEVWLIFAAPPVKTTTNAPTRSESDRLPSPAHSHTLVSPRRAVDYAPASRTNSTSSATTTVLCASPVVSSPPPLSPRAEALRSPPPPAPFLGGWIDASPFPLPPPTEKGGSAGAAEPEASAEAATNESSNANAPFDVMAFSASASDFSSVDDEEEGVVAAEEEPEASEAFASTFSDADTSVSADARAARMTPPASLPVANALSPPATPNSPPLAWADASEVSDREEDARQEVLDSEEGTASTAGALPFASRARAQWSPPSAEHSMRMYDYEPAIAGGIATDAVPRPACSAPNPNACWEDSDESDLDAAFAALPRRGAKASTADVFVGGNSGSEEDYY